jgi:hypothetical protein
MPFCNGAKRCNRKKLPRCLVCNAVYKPEVAQNKRFMLCVKGKQAHMFSTDGVNACTVKEMAVFDAEVLQ